MRAGAQIRFNQLIYYAPGALVSTQSFQGHAKLRKVEAYMFIVYASQVSGHRSSRPRDQAAAAVGDRSGARGGVGQPQGPPGDGDRSVLPYPSPRAETPPQLMAQNWQAE